MALRNVSLITAGALAVAAALGWGVSMLGGSDSNIDIQEVGDSAWRVDVEEAAPASSALEMPSD